MSTAHINTGAVGILGLQAGEDVKGAYQVQAYLAEKQLSVVSSTNVGQLVNAKSILSDWDGDSMQVETSGGFFTVRGTMEMIKDQPFVHEVRASGNALLCQGEPKRCLQIVRSGLQ